MKTFCVTFKKSVSGGFCFAVALSVDVKPAVEYGGNGQWMFDNLAAAYRRAFELAAAHSARVVPTLILRVVMCERARSVLADNNLAWRVAVAHVAMSTPAPEPNPSKNEAARAFMANIMATRYPLADRGLAYLPAPVAGERYIERFARQLEMQNRTAHNAEPVPRWLNPANDIFQDDY